MEELNDYELLEYISSKNEEAYNLMLEKYKPLILSTAKKYKNIGLKYGYEMNDIIQEGMVGLSNAIETYDEKLNTKFYTLAKVCIERKILNLFKTAAREKYKILNESIPIENDNYDLEKMIGDITSNPLNVVLDKEIKNDILKELEKKLSESERQVLNLKQEGFSNMEISKILNKTIKQIENTIQRIKKKYKETII